MKRILAAALIAAAALAGPAQSNLVFDCTSVGSMGQAPCSEPTGAFVEGLGPLASYLITMPNGYERLITLPDYSWEAGGLYELVFLDSWTLMELYFYGIGPGGFLDRLAYITGGPDTTGATHDWQALGTWSVTSSTPTSSVPEPGTLAIVALALVAGWLARRGVSTGGSGS